MIQAMTPVNRVGLLKKPTREGTVMDIAVGKDVEGTEDVVADVETIVETMEVAMAVVDKINVVVALEDSGVAEVVEGTIVGTTGDSVVAVVVISLVTKSLPNDDV